MVREHLVNPVQTVDSVTPGATVEVAAFPVIPAALDVAFVRTPSGFAVVGDVTVKSRRPVRARGNMHVSEIRESPFRKRRVRQEPNSFGETEAGDVGEKGEGTMTSREGRHFPHVGHFYC